jgi:maltose alpha-D-glucosyltransferase/alpha-amylase
VAREDAALAFRAAGFAVRDLPHPTARALKAMDTLAAKPKTKRRRAAHEFSADPLWYKDAVIYQLHVKSFLDANGDGIGDFAGLIEKLDYIADLGVNTVWLLPFYPSPRRDDGYDISDYTDVHADYGVRADAKRFVTEAHARGLRVITELVLNHTSDQHPWFQRARKSPPGSWARDFYVWSDTDTRYAGTRIIFLDTEKSNWTWDPVANAYYWHRFYAHQPDLNFESPRVLKAVLTVLRFWLAVGVDGYRLDAVPYLVEREGTSNENLPETHALLKRIRAELDRTNPGKMLLAEANQWPEDVQQYFGNGDECHMAFHFPLMPRMYMALAQEDRFPITDILRQTPDIPPTCQWAIFLRNHDELTLEMVTDRERDYLWKQYAVDARARLNLGIRRRLAPLMQRDRRRIELLNSLLLSMPGAPVIYYGDEIGMGDNIHLGDRDGVRTPMQWSLDRNGGFSRADPAALVLPPIMDSLYGFQAVNVEAQARDPHSLLNWMRRMLTIRKQQQAFGRGNLRLLYPSNRRVFAYLREYVGDGSSAGSAETILCVANVSRSAQAVELDLAQFSGRVPVEMLGGAAFPPVGQLPYLLTLPPYGFFWFVLAAAAQMPAWHTPAPEALPDLNTFVIRSSLEEMLVDPARSVLEQQVLPAYLPKRRWFGAKDQAVERVELATTSTVPGTSPPVLLTELVVKSARGSSRYLLPLGFVPEEELTTALPQQLALARVRRAKHVGLLTDAYALDSFVRRLTELLLADARIPTGAGELRFIRTARLQTITLGPDAEVRRSQVEQSNSSIIVGQQMIIKLFRRIHAGPHPEAEMGLYLSEQGYNNIAPLLGEISRLSNDGELYVLGIAQAFIFNQGDAWNWTQNMLDRAIQTVIVLPENVVLDDQLEPIREFQSAAAILGRRLGEMHVALGRPTQNPAFAPVKADPAECAAWAHAVTEQLEGALSALGSAHDWSAEDRALCELVLSRREALLQLPQTLAAHGVGTLLTRIHGDLHLGQALVSQADAYFIDFEGEPARPLQQRRAKASPLRDVAGMLRSFDYAAATAIASGGAGQNEVAVARKRDIINRFRAVSEREFLSSYAAALSELPEAVLSQPARTALLDLFLLDKVCYEIAYEAANRPAWLGIPLRGLAALVSRLTESTTKP